MKSIVKTLIAASLSIAAVSACSEEKLSPSTTGTKTTVHFGATSSVVDNATKATLTTDDDNRFIGAWENGDEIGIQYTYVKASINETTLGTWDKAKSMFSAEIEDMTTGDEVFEMKYNASYPYSKDSYVDFGSNRTQVGASYNSKYDLMVAEPVTVTAKPGVDAEGKAIVFPMQRQTAIAYFHLTSDNTEAVTKATLKVEGENAAIAAETVLLDPTGMSYENGLQEIVLTTTDQTADDFQLWFNVLPTSYDSITLTVETATKTLTINNAKAGKYEAGHLYKVKGTLADDKWVSKETVYTTLAELNEAILAGETEFKLNLSNPAVITRICPDNKTTYLQDKTGGVMYYSLTKIQNAVEGMTISGEVSGKATLFNGHPEITSIVTTDATLDTTADIPCLNLTVADLNAGFNKYLNAMVRLTDVEVSDSFSNSDKNGKVKQGDEELAVYVKSTDTFEASLGSIGNVVLFPALYNDNQQAYFWDSSDFEATKIATVISVSSSVTVKVGETVDLGATTNSTASLKYVSDTPTNVAVTEDGKITGVAEGTANVTINCDADGKFTAASKVVVVTVVAEDAPDKYFIKVTAEPTNWSGKYLIVFSDNKARSYVNKKDLSNASGATVTDEGGKIKSTDTVNKDIVVITEVDGGYNIQYSNNKYMTVPASNACGADVKNNAAVMTLEYSDSGISISGVDSKKETRFLYNNQTFYRMYKQNNGYELPTLYRLED